jgi:hypothetical protein
MQDLPNYVVSCHVGARESVTLMMYRLGAEEVMRGELEKKRVRKSQGRHKLSPLPGSLPIGCLVKLPSLGCIARP